MFILDNATLGGQDYGHGKSTQNYKIKAIVGYQLRLGDYILH
jgi:hypothetical protein